jgi:hypothetical protein
MIPVSSILIIEEDTIIAIPVSTMVQKKRCGITGEISPGELIAKESPIVRSLLRNVITPGIPRLAYNPGKGNTKDA